MSPLLALRGIVAALLTAFFFAAPAQAEANKQQELVDKARYTVEAFMGAPDMQWLRDNIGRAKGVLVIPSMGKGGLLLVGGSGGSGVFLARDPQSGVWSYPAFYTMGSFNFGPQIGGQVSEMMLLVMTPAGVDSLMTSKFQLGGDVSVAAGPVGAGAKAATADVIAFSRTKGLYGGISLEGAVIEKRTKWNSSYYGRAVEPEDIIVRRNVSNAGADPLRRAVAMTVR